MHSNLIVLLNFKPALYCSTLVIKLINSSVKLFYAKILTVTRPVFYYRLRNPHSTPTFKLKSFVLLVMYCWLNGFYCEMNG